jgi:hypothetical protein
MRKTTLTILGALLVAGSVVQMASATEHHTRKHHRTPVAASEQFLNANNAGEEHLNSVCQYKESGNPYNERTDYWSWSAWRESGAWDSRGNC